MSSMLFYWLAATPGFAAPFLLATVGLIVNERAGVMNLGVEGIMAMGAVVPAIVMLSGGSAPLALLSGALAGLALTLVFAFLAVLLRVEQVLAGLVTFALGIGVSGYIGQSYNNAPVSGLPALPAALFAWAPAPLAALLDQDGLTYAAFGAAILIWFVIERTDLGLRLRAVGEDAPAADAAGVNVFTMRLCAVIVGGILCGLAGTHLSLVGGHLWVDGMVAGRGWIAVAMVTLSRWSALRAIAASLVFGAVEAAIPQILSSGMNVPVYFIEMSPYVMTLLYLMAAGLFQKNANAEPADLARPFLREERR